MKLLEKIFGHWKRQAGSGVPTVHNRYDALKFDPLRPIRPTRTEPTVTEQFFSGDKRLKSYALCDDLYDNDGAGATLDTSIRLTIGQTGGIPRFLGDDREERQKIFDSWRRCAGWADGENYTDLLSMILRAVKLHGDCLILLDEDLTEGRLRLWDADQICSVNSCDFTAWARETGAEEWRQVEGVVLDGEGRTMGWFVTSLRNRTAVPLDDATYISASLGRRVSYHRKITQVRGEPALLPNVDLTNDTLALIKSEVQAARNAAEISLVVVKPANAASHSAMAAFSSGMTSEQLTDGTGIDAETLNLMQSASRENDTFKAFSGHSAIAEVENGTQIQNLSNANRPAASIQSWMDNLSDANGRRLGVMSCLSRGRADNSYSSGQIELEISWKQFEEDQKLLERQVVDYVVDRMLPGSKYVVSWPRQFEIDPQKAEATRDAAILGGRSTLQDYLGPYWREKLDAQAEEMSYAKARGLTTTPYLRPQAGAAAILRQGDENGND